jgi:predicted permease
MSLRREVSKFAALFRRRKPADDLAEEICSHLEMEEQENLESGMPPEEAHYAALRRFGNVPLAQERSREMWAWNWLEHLMRDARLGLRTLARSPGFTAVAVLTLALGVGAAALVFSVVYGAILNPFPYRDADRIMQMAFLDKQGIRGFMAVNGHDLETVRHASTVEDAMFTDVVSSITNVNGYPEGVVIDRLSGNAFDFLGVAPLFGRTLTRDDQNQAVVVLGYAFCRAHYQCDQSVLGRKLDLDHRQFTIVGVMSPRFAWQGAAAFIPLVPGKGPDDTYHLYVRPRKGVRAEVLSAQMLALLRQFVLASEGVELSPDTILQAMALGQWGGGFQHKRLELLFAAVCVLLLIACANVSILLLGRATVRQHEFEIRNALGASRSRLAFQLLTEALLIALGGGVLGIVITYGGVAVLRAPLLKSFFPAGAVLTVNGSVLAFSTALSLITGFLFGLLPSLQVSKSSCGPKLNVQFKSPSRRGRKSHRLLVAAQIASTLVLLVAAGAVIRAFVDLCRLDLGYDPRNVLTFWLIIPKGEYASWTARMQYREVLQERLKQIPGVEDASVGEAVPPNGGYAMEYGLASERFGPDMDQKMPHADVEFIDAHFFRTMRIPIISGRPFTQSEYENGSPIALISRTFARRLFGASDPVGGELRMPPLVAGYEGKARPKDAQEMVRIVGVTGNVPDLGSPGAPPRESIYLPESLLVDASSLRVSLRAKDDPRAILATARRVIKQLNHDQPMSQARTLSEILSEDFRSRDRWLALLFGAFSSLALFFAVIGLYSVTSFAVAQRTREIGVRIALGAARGDIFRGVLTSESGAVFSGLAAGAALSLSLGRLLRSLVSMPTQSTWLLPASCAVMLIVSALACYFPASRATKVDPMVALRCE